MSSTAALDTASECVMKSLNMDGMGLVYNGEEWPFDKVCACHAYFHLKTHAFHAYFHLKTHAFHVYFHLKTHACHVCFHLPRE
jgi:hypothetical protein